MNSISEYLYRKASVNKIPLNGTFELSPVCNFSCRMCYIRKSSKKIAEEGKELKTWRQWLKLAEECRDAGMLYLLLTGGEPFLYPGFKELYIELHKMGLLVSINTNGTMIDDQVLDWLKEYPPHRINITLYGACENTYERICGNRNGYGKAVASILKLKEMGIYVVINGSMIPENANDLEQIIDFGKKNNIPTRISTYMFPPIRREQESTDSRLTPAQSAYMCMKKYKCQMEEVHLKKYVKSKLDTLKNQDLEEDADWGIQKEERMRCRAGRSTFWISWEGIMTACGMIPFPIETFPFEDNFYNSWMELTNRVRNVKVLKECSRCGKKEICEPCVAMLYTENKTVDEKAPYLCEYTERLIQEMKSYILEKEFEGDVNEKK